ncbi:probable mediator of RNA polymerase II transcription subunit 26a [Neltuma alba]|uniref:probable mediator of RNA polymerase II transcription subunit 26a n=1 Tax=Neltuma alba TaxID=207710 RepID=UPI0010A53FD5|nr:probable mediator of RNA polymerase II transcription subunit 26a [Prosopis alba]
MEAKSLEEWRKYFESGNCSIYRIIFNAIRIAALDDPEEFKLRRNKIVERLYSCQFTGLCAAAALITERDIHSTIKQVFQHCENACAHHKSTKVVDDSAVGGATATDQQANEPGNNDEDEDETVRCVLQIRDELESNELTDSEIYGSLKKLQLVVQSVFVMEATKIGKTISNLRRHRTKEISLLATIMADQWKSKIVEFVDNKTAGTTAEKSKNPVPRFVLDEWREFPSVEYVPQPPVEFSEV